MEIKTDRRSLDKWNREVSSTHTELETRDGSLSGPNQTRSLDIQRHSHSSLLTSPLVASPPVFGEKIDIQKLLSKLPFTTTGIPNELHLINHQFTGPGSNLFYENESRPGRLYEDPTKDNYLQPKEWSTPINQLDEAAYRHDLKYYFAGYDLELKHKVDNEMIKELENYTPDSLIDKFYKWVVIRILSMKVKFGLGQVPLDELTAKLEAKELHHPYRTGLRRIVIVNGIDDTHACDLIEMPSEVGPKHVKYSYVFTNIDIFSKY